MISDALTTSQARELKAFLCPDMANMPTISGSYEETEFDFVRIQIRGCNLTDDDPLGRVCKTREEITGLRAEVIYLNSRIDMRPKTVMDNPMYIINRFADFKNYVTIEPSISKSTDIFLAP